METTTLLYGTQRQYVDEIKSNGITKKNSSAFIINEMISWDIDFTLLTALYHAIGLSVQHWILSEGYNYFSDFYLQNSWFLPVLITFRQTPTEKVEIDDYYQHLDNNAIRTYPYSKINLLWVVDIWSVTSITPITMQDILDVENIVWAIPKTKSKERFFTKSSSSIPKIHSSWVLGNFDLIDSDYIYRFLEKLSQRVKLVLSN